MEIILLSKSSLKIKGKRASVVLDPDSGIKGKIAADAIIVFPNVDSDTSKVEEWRVCIRGGGEYEVGGIKISGVKNGKHFVYKLFIDGISVAFASFDSLEGLRDALSGQHILVLSVFEKVDLSLIATLEPRIVILYGEKAGEIPQKDDVVKAAKFVITKEKLPEKMETILLQ